MKKTILILIILVTILGCIKDEKQYDENGNKRPIYGEEIKGRNQIEMNMDLGFVTFKSENNNLIISEDTMKVGAPAEYYNEISEKTAKEFSKFYDYVVENAEEVTEDYVLKNGKHTEKVVFYDKEKDMKVEDYIKSDKIYKYRGKVENSDEIKTHYVGPYFTIVESDRHIGFHISPKPEKNNYDKKIKNYYFGLNVKDLNKKIFYTGLIQKRFNEKYSLMNKKNENKICLFINKINEGFFYDNDIINKRKIEYNVLFKELGDLDKNCS